MRLLTRPILKQSPADGRRNSRRREGKASPIEISPYGECEITHIQMELGHNGTIMLQTHRASAFYP
jgi:hypothetical protein